jgi:hypothetical protein
VLSAVSAVWGLKVIGYVGGKKVGVMLWYELKGGKSNRICWGKESGSEVMV